MRATLLLVPVLLGAFLAATPSASADCAPPCGPIPVVIEMKMNGEKYVTFGDQDEYVSEGVVSFYVNVDGDGFWFDPEKKPVLTFKLNRQPPWVKGQVEPASYVVPVDDPQYLQDEGSPDQVQFYWEAPLKITVKKLRDPTPQELGTGSAFVRKDGSFRVVVSASSTASVIAPDLLGPTNGLQEGYGVKELRFIPEVAGVTWLPDDAGVLRPNGVAPAPKGDSPAFGALGVVAAAVIALLVAARRRH